MLLSSLVRLAGRLLRVRGRGISAACAMVLATAITTISGIGVVGVVGVVGVGSAHAQECDPVEVAKILADDGAAYDEFGKSVSFDGDTAVIGAFEDDDNGVSSGSAYIFTRNGGVWTQQVKLLPGDGAAGDRFGYSVSISGDTAVIGASSSYHGQGSAYVFTRSGGVWTEVAQLLASDGAFRDSFGFSVSIDGDTAVIGALVDDDNGSESGSAYVFTRSGGVWTQQAKLLPADGAAGDRFSNSISLRGDTVVIGAHFDDDNGFKSGSAYVFTRSGGVWTQQAKLLPADGEESDNFGQCVSLSGDTAIIGAYWDDDNGPASGSAYVFTRSGGVWTQQAKLLLADGAAHDRFGRSVALSGDTALIGAWTGEDNDPYSGSVYIFTRSGGIWTEQAGLQPGDGGPNDEFGVSVSLIGDTALIGAFGDSDNGFKSGSAYVFDLGCDACPADLNGDGLVNIQDFILFRDLWSASDPLADWDENGLIDTRDFIAYLGDWAAGCP